MKTKAAIVLVLMALAASAGRHYWLNAHGHRAGAEQPVATRPAEPARFTATLETAHYAIASTAAPSQTALVSDAVESLHGAYTTFWRLTENRCRSAQVETGPLQGSAGIQGA
ncbi:hypothetical protein [Lysobacter sp. CFH 32150]|uniref:hypothetical protein n=1 Tax=Lysobacter sp. CFH 32150 TaxID=2927128 RepID=UPI001FA77F69|nr:hypothetical protein [Lysobacter sp. CFH 32150]